jgi:hypothetical protein
MRLTVRRHTVRPNAASISRRILIASIAVFAVVFATSPAAFAADDDIYWETTDGNPGGGGSFDARGSAYPDFAACDQQADGYRVVVRIYEKYKNWNLIGRADATGGNGTCAFGGTLYLPEDMQMKATVCLQKGFDGTPLWCNTKYPVT